MFDNLREDWQVNARMDEALDWIASRAREKSSSLVAFVNPDCLNIAHQHAGYHKILTNAARVLPDGIGIKLGCRLLGVELRENVNGTDIMFPRLCERATREGLGLYLLGAGPGVAEAAADEMRRDIPFDKQVNLDVEYIESQSTRLDLRLLLLTVPAVALGKGAY